MDYELIWDKIYQKVDVQMARLAGGIPYIPINGRYENMVEKDIAWWTNGFYPGLLWQLYYRTEREVYRENAVKVEQALDQALAEYVGIHHDVGFMWLLSAVANYRLTGNRESYLRGIKAAGILASRLNLNGRYLRAWNEQSSGWTIIDSMMNIPLLYWAAREEGDPRFSAIAIAHAKTVQQYLLRPDGSLGHIASFDPLNGTFIEQIGGQGYAANSAWSRGQSWAIYGFALSYKHTKEPSFLTTAIKSAYYFLANVGLTGFVPAVDFKAPPIPQNTDTSAGLIACCGLLEIAKHVSVYEQPLFRQGAEQILEAIVSEYCDFDLEVDGIVYGGAESYHNKETKNTALIYSDYFLIEAMAKLAGNELDVW